MICAISSCKVTGIVLHLIINYVNISNKPSAVTNVVICNAVGVVPLIAQGWRQPTLGYACSEEVNAVGVVRFLRGILR